MVLEKGSTGQSNPMNPQEIVSFEPATGAILWRGPVGDVDAEVDIARGAWAEWASRPLTVRIETMRRFGNVVRARTSDFADRIARETGKPLWEARTEVEAVIDKVDISVAAHNERTAHRRLLRAVRFRIHADQAVPGLLRL